MNDIFLKSVFIGVAMKTCFVIMAIGDQTVDGEKIGQSDLKEKYASLIKEAISKARPNLEITRADEISLPGTMTTDIITRIMHSDFVVADVTYPNPNVFYELGLRHACRTGTIIIKDKNGPKVPFDIAHLRYIEYENTTPGLKSLSSALSESFGHFDATPDRPDNHFQEIAKLTNYKFPDYGTGEEFSPEVQLISALIGAPDIMNLFIREQSGEDVDQAEVMKALLANPDVAKPILEAMVKNGDFSLQQKKIRKPTGNGRRRS